MNTKTTLEILICFTFISRTEPPHNVTRYVPRATRARNQFDHFVQGLLIFIEWSIHEVDI